MAFAPPWKPGQSGNPGGRPVKKPFTEALRKALANKDGASPEDQGKTLTELAVKLVELGLTGERWAIVEIRDTLEGKPAQAITGADNHSTATACPHDGRIKEQQP